MYSTVDNIKKSLEQAWKYKILWVFALLLAGGSSFSYQANVSSKNVTSVTPDLQEKFGNANPLEFFQAFLGPKYSNIDINYFIPHIVILIISFLIFVSVAVFMLMILRSWATGSVIRGTLDAGQKDLTLKELSYEGRRNLLKIIKLDMLLLFIYLGLLIFSVVIPLVLLVTISVSDQNFAFWLIPLTTFLIILFILVAIALGYSRLFAVRYIVEDNVTIKEALKIGFKAFKSNIGNSIKLTLANCFIQAFLSLIVVSILGTVAFFSFVGGNTSTIPVIVTVGLAIPLGVAAVLGFSALRGFMGVYDAFTWTNLYRHVRGSSNE